MADSSDDERMEGQAAVAVAAAALGEPVVVDWLFQEGVSARSRESAEATLISHQNDPSLAWSTADIKTIKIGFGLPTVLVAKEVANCLFLSVEAI